MCPGFPICDNALLHGTAPVRSAPQQQWQPQPQWQQPQPQWQQPQAQAWSAPVNQWNPQPQTWAAQSWNQWDAPALSGPSTNDINGAGGDK